MQDSLKDSLYFAPISYNELFCEIMKLNPKKSSGHDGFSPKLIMNTAEPIIEPLLHIYNLSLSTGIVPSAMKISKVIPVLKKLIKVIQATIVQFRS